MSRTKAIVSALITMLLWGSLFPMVKLGFSLYEVEGTADILLFAGLRFLICGAAICIFAFIKNKQTYHGVFSALPAVLLSGLFAIVLHYSFSYLGLELTDSSKTALIKQVGALFYVCFSFIFIKEDRPSIKKIIAAIIGFVGIIVLNIGPGGISFRIGDFLILSASFCTVFSNVVSKKLFVKAEPITATGVSQLFGGIVLLTVGAIMGGGMVFRFDLSLLVFVYICVASIVSYCLWYGVVKHGELSKLFIIKFAEPVFACIFGALILGEEILKIQYLISFILISGSILFSNLTPKKSK